jgi:hypothetical protein
MAVESTFINGAISEDMFVDMFFHFRCKTCTGIQFSRPTQLLSPRFGLWLNKYTRIVPTVVAIISISRRLMYCIITDVDTR